MRLAILIGICFLQEAQSAALADELGAQVAGHDQYSISEVDPRP
jgi:hypothetical protein